MTTKSCSLIAICLFSVVASSCYTPTEFLLKEYQIGVIAQTSVGSSILRWASGTRSRLMSHNSGYVDTTVVFYSVDQINSPQATLKELVYKGTADEKLLCVYREYLLGDNGALAKPVFFLDVTYDLKQSNMIGYQDFKIRIEKADQQRLTFTVLEEPKMMNEGRLRREMKR
jgi:hypothetical protein